MLEKLARMWDGEVSVFPVSKKEILQRQIDAIDKNMYMMFTDERMDCVIIYRLPSACIGDHLNDYRGEASDPSVNRVYPEESIAVGDSIMLDGYKPTIRLYDAARKRYARGKTTARLSMVLDGSVSKLVRIQ